MGRASRRKRESRSGGGFKLPANFTSSMQNCESRVRYDHGDPKIAKELADLIRPVADDVTSVEEYRSLVAVAVIAWNFSVLAVRAPDRARQLLKRSRVPDDAGFKAVMAELISRKKSLYPDDRRLVAGYEVTLKSDGSYLLTATATGDALDHRLKRIKGFQRAQPRRKPG